MGHTHVVNVYIRKGVQTEHGKEGKKIMSGRREDNVSRKEIELYKIQRKDNASNIQAVAMAARNAGMTYGQYVAMQYAKENCIRRHGVK